MPTDHRTELATIKRFDQLVRYLHERMGWPIDRGDFEELTFQYTAEELGIDPKNAAKIQEIKRLRPLVPKQPWGIFFVKFEPKKLPVVALRRILSQVALKKRASANSAERTAWAGDDLLFVSNYGEGDERQISFAHFATPADGHDLPTLKVLGWNNLDTALHLDAVARELTQQLAWPDEEADLEGWRQRWSAAFTLRHREVITTSRDLSVRLAELARAIRDRIKAALAIETERGPLTKLMKAFQEALLGDLDADGFADMYAQTIAYGLLSARIADPHKKTTDDFAGHMRTNPFLRELMEAFLKVGGRHGTAGGRGIDFDELGVSEVVELLDDANMEAVIRDFGDRNPQEDPVIHFYEGFAKEYDPIEKVKRGEFYTPRPVVSYIVRSVDEFLRTEFGLADGLADTTTWGEMAKRHRDLKIPEGVSSDEPFVQILDPATGTGTFLVEVINLIYRTLHAKWQTAGHGERQIKSLWNEYVPRHLLPRLYAYELKMAPYAIAHLKIGLILYETGYRFASDERARIYLTNALEPATNTEQLKLAGIVPALAHEAHDVNQVKRGRRFTVVVGNPPYSGHSANEGAWMSGLLQDYYMVDGKALQERNTKWLQDDYVKFLRLAQGAVEAAGVGLLGCITNHGYIGNPTFRGMRQNFLHTFSVIRVFDLHGNSKRKEVSPDGTADENVFEIQQGVAITFGVRHVSGRKDVCHADLYGSRERKYAFLLNNAASRTPWIEVAATPPFYLFRPQDEARGAEYGRFFKVTDLFPVNVLGFQSHRDHFAIDFERSALVTRMAKFRSPELNDAEIKNLFEVADNRDWHIKDVRKRIRNDENWKRSVLMCAYRPFDYRPCYFSTVAMDFPRRELLDHVAGKENTCLCVSRQQATEGFRHCWIADAPPNDCLISSTSREANQVFPLYIYPEQEGLTLYTRRRPNLAGSVVEALSELGSTPESFLQYTYAVLHSSGYRERYAEFLRVDFPRLPITKDAALFQALAACGKVLIDLHLLRSPLLSKTTCVYSGAAAPEVERIAYERDTVWLDRAHESGFRRVPEAVWSLQIGGYQVCEKWLKDRKGRTLSQEDIAHYQKIVVALGETIRLTKEIDMIIGRQGGWPDAFQASAIAPGGAGQARKASPLPAKGTQYEPVQPRIRKVAEHRISSQGDGGDGGEDTEDDPTASANDRWKSVNREELICRLRALLSSGSERDRESAVAELARSLGFRRVGFRIREEVDNAIRTAVRRGILETEDGSLRICARSVGGYERSFLKEQFLASLNGRQWTGRKDAIQAFARWMGFRRTGAAIVDTARSLINGLLREGKLESDGSNIRRVSA